MFEFDEEIFIYKDTRKDGRQFWFFSVLKKKPNGTSRFIDFSIDKETLSFFENDLISEPERAKEKDVEELLSYEVGRDIIEQIKIIATEMEKLEKQENLNFSFFDDKKWNKKRFAINFSVENSPIVIQYSYNMELTKLSSSFHLLKNYSHKCFLVPFHNLVLSKEDVKVLIRKHSKQRLRMLTRNSN